VAEDSWRLAFRYGFATGTARIIIHPKPRHVATARGENVIVQAQRLVVTVARGSALAESYDHTVPKAPATTVVSTVREAQVVSSRQTQVVVAAVQAEERDL
jgi:hypothetical protein